ncbi:MAG: antibiotic biosynthesis monooxygenase [Gemmatimonadetes bacterium]|nr:antibiotic biosynthesis monooxygenase [Gemmatimonadota bacterium]
MPITRLNEFHAHPGKEAELRAFLQSIIVLIEDAPGCVSVTLLAGHDDPTRFAIVEEWIDVAAHQAAAGRIPPELLAEFRPLVAEPPKGAYYQAI